MLKIPIPFTGWKTDYIVAGRRIIGLGWLYAGLYFETKYKDESKWHVHHWGGHAIMLRWRWEWGEEHIYYDAPHCFYMFGPITIEWSKSECEKCHPGW